MYLLGMLTGFILAIDLTMSYYKDMSEKFKESKPFEHQDHFYKCKELDMSQKEYKSDGD